MAALITKLIADERGLHANRIAKLEEMRDVIAFRRDVVAVGEWLSYSDLAKVWDTSKAAAKKRVARIAQRRTVPRRQIGGLAHVDRAALDGHLPPE